MNFADIWARAEIDDVVRVRDGKPEPSPGTLAHSQWRSHNCEGPLRAKLEATNDRPRRLQIEAHVSEAATVAYEIREDGAHSFSMTQRLDAVVEDRLGALAARRWQATQVFVYAGISTPCDSALSAITGAVVALQVLGGGTTKWKMAPGQFVEMDLAALISFGLAARAHIQACFDNEADLSAAIAAAATIAEANAVNLDVGWP